MKTIYQLDRVDLAKIVAGILGLPVTSDSVESFFGLLYSKDGLGSNEMQSFIFYRFRMHDSRVTTASHLLLNLRAYYGYTLTKLNTGNQRAALMGHNEIESMDDTSVARFTEQFDRDLKHILHSMCGPAFMEVFYG